MARNKHPEETIALIIDNSLVLFMEKGYDNTSIQDIIDSLGGLSKGAIYHHFKSKEEIFEAVCDKIGRENTVYYESIRDAPNKTGYEKLKSMLESAYLNPNNDIIISMAEKILREPKFLVSQISDIFELIAPCYLQPVIEQGIRDGSINTTHPKELAEVMITLMNIWINPVISKSKPSELKSKVEFFGLILRNLGIDIIDEESIQQYEELGKRIK